MIRRPPRSTHCISSAASDVYKRQVLGNYVKNWLEDNLPPKLYDEMAKTVVPYTEENERNEVVSYFKNLFKEKTEEFNNSINKLSPVGANA